jgi:insertion element IS1 protein InsB
MQCGMISKKVPNALDRATGQWLDGECGHRDQRPFKKLSKRLRPWKGQIYGTDADQVSRAIIPERRLGMSKRGTTGIERHHTPNRHGCARFKRTSIVVSKSLEMVALTMAL